MIEVHVARGRHGQGRGPAADARVRQGHHGRAVAGRRHGHRPQGQGRRPGRRGRPDPAPADRCGQPAPPTAPRRRQPDRAAPSRPAPPRATSMPRSWSWAPGPGGYSAAFRAADLGQHVVLVERWPTLGGVCLNVGCIPSKALLHAAKVIAETEEMGHLGLTLRRARVDLDALRGWKDSVVKHLTGGLAGLAKARKVTVVRGVGRFISLDQLEVDGRRRRHEDRQLRAGDHRRRLRAGDAAVHPARRPARDRLHRRPRARRRAEAAPGHRRRHHRAGDGDGLPRAGREGDHRRAHGPDHPRCGHGPGHAAAQADRASTTRTSSSRPR